MWSSAKRSENVLFSIGFYDPLKILLFSFPRKGESRKRATTGLPLESIPAKLAPAKAGGGDGSYTQGRDRLASSFTLQPYIIFHSHNWCNP
jgi:hypothetical protein